MGEFSPIAACARRDRGRVHHADLRYRLRTQPGRGENAVDKTAKEIGTRFDFKGSSAAVELKDKEITLFGDSEFQLGQVEDILIAKLTKRNVDVRFLDRGRRSRRSAATRSSR